MRSEWSCAACGGVDHHDDPFHDDHHAYVHGSPDERDKAISRHWSDEVVRTPDFAYWRGYNSVRYHDSTLESSLFIEAFKMGVADAKGDLNV